MTNSVFDQAERSMEGNVRIDMSSIFPGPGTYAVTPSETQLLYENEEMEKKRIPKTVRFKLDIDKVMNDAKSSLVGRSFSIFFGLITKQAKDAPAPVSFTARRLYYLFEGEYPTEDINSMTPVWSWLRQLEKGQSFIVERTVKRDKNNVLRANDKLLSFETFESLHGDATPEEAPEVASAVGDF